MASETTKSKAPWDDGWTEDDSDATAWDHKEAAAAIERFGSEIDAALDSLLKRTWEFTSEYGDHTGMDGSTQMEAILFRRLQNLMIEIGRQALMYFYSCDGLDRQTLPLPRTNDEAMQVLRDAIALYEHLPEKIQEPDSKRTAQTDREQEPDAEASARNADV